MISNAQRIAYIEIKQAADRWNEYLVQKLGTDEYSKLVKDYSRNSNAQNINFNSVIQRIRDGSYSNGPRQFSVPLKVATQRELIELKRENTALRKAMNYQNTPCRHPSREEGKSSSNVISPASYSPDCFSPEAHIRAELEEEHKKEIEKLWSRFGQERQHLHIEMSRLQQQILSHCDEKKKYQEQLELNQVACRREAEMLNGYLSLLEIHSKNGNKFVTALLKREITLRCKLAIQAEKLNEMSASEVAPNDTKQFTDANYISLQADLSEAQRKFVEEQRECKMLRESLAIYRKTSEQLLDEMSNDRETAKTSTLKKLAALEAQQDELTTTNMKLEGQVSALQNQLDESKQVNESLEALNKERDELQNARDELNSKLVATESELVALRRERDELAEHMKANAMNNVELQTLQAKLDEHRNRVAELETERMTLMSTEKDYRARLNDIQNDSTKMHEELRSVKSRYNDAMKELSYKTHQLRDITKSLEIYRKTSELMLDEGKKKNGTEGVLGYTIKSMKTIPETPSDDEQTPEISDAASLSADENAEPKRKVESRTFKIGTKRPSKSAPKRQAKKVKK